MKRITATELKNKTSEAIAAAQKEPISIEKNGRPVAVMIAQADYEHLMQLENDYWLARIEVAEKTGYIGTEATASFIKEKLTRDAKTRPNK
jgi:prevent-host-death family protein